MHSGFVSVIAMYTPMNDDEPASDNFYQDFQEAMSQVPKSDMVLVMGDFNTWVRKDSESTWGGKHSPDVRNENGERLLDFCSLMSLWSPTLSSNTDIVIR